MQHRNIQFGKDTVTKTSEPRLMRIEVEKTRRAYEIGKNSGLFHVPEVLEYDEVNGVAVFKLIKHIHPVRSAMDGSLRYKSLMEQIGRSLAVIHRKLTLPHGMTITLPSEFNLPGTEVFLHGDFNGMNICVSPCLPPIVILDWQTTAVHGGQATYGSRYFDLIWFVNYMLWTPTFYYLFCDPVSKAARCFLESYFKESEFPYDAEMIARYAKLFFETEQPFRKQNAHWSNRYLLPRSRLLTQRFVESLKTITIDGPNPHDNNQIKKG